MALFPVSCWNSSQLVLAGLAGMESSGIGMEMAWNFRKFDEIIFSP